MRERHRRRHVPASTTVLAALALAAGLALAPSPAGAVAFTTQFRLEDCRWSNRGSQNPYWSLRPGYQQVLLGEEDGAEIEVHITVLRQRETISFESANGTPVTVRARVVEEREWEDGELIEVSRNWVARCVQTGDVYYFGEDVDDYEDGEIGGHEGAWRAGEDGALPGILMPGTFLLGAKYYQEIAPDVALDRARHVDMGLDLEVPAGSFTDCVVVKETNALDPDSEGFKVYCPGVGLIMDETLMLMEYGVVPAGRPARARRR